MADLPVWRPASPEAWHAVRDRLAPPPGDPWPRLTEYLLDLGVLLQRRLFGWLGDVLPSWAASEELWLAGVYVVAGLVLGILAWTVYRFLTTRSRRLDAREIEPEILPGDEPQPATPETWSRRFRRRLREASWTEALEALWWWVATRIGPPGLSPAWTTDQLLARAGRAELESPMRELDRLRYGSGSEDREGLLRLHRRLREILG